MRSRRPDSNKQLKAPLMVYEKRMEQMDKLLDELQDFVNKGSIIVVEGKRDVIALKSLGICGEFQLATHHSLVNFSEDLSKTGKQVVILTDWDRRGNILADKLVKNLQSLGSNPDTRIRDLIISLVQKEIKDIESLPGYVEKLREITKGTDMMDTL
ncbi:toprim domain-containing protein [uncultured Methanolobus sp.]|uniref:toprim domain-containing protein n=1 Tax=uncultured Methanolobus sp. TaxID=218300 RepID=UPI002AAAA406|nr:toprim domain-containing protein [uncultured Methanolobus sp.]